MLVITVKIHFVIGSRIYLTLSIRRPNTVFYVLITV